MVYIPRHYKSTRKKNVRPWIFFSILLLLAATGYFYKGEILNLFLGSETKRLNRLIQKVEAGLASGSSEIRDIEDFISIAASFQKNDPVSAEASHMLAKGNYYKIRFIGQISSSKLMEVAIAEGMAGLVAKYPEAASDIEAMYRSALKARAISNREDWVENEMLVILGEIYRPVKSIHTIFEEFRKFKEPDGDLKQAYFWNSLVLSLLSGNASHFEQTLQNTASPFKFTMNEQDFLRGYLYYNGKDYVKSLFLLRKSRAVENEDIQFYSSVLEAMIFSHQNLPGRSLEILEQLYKDWPGRQPIVRKKFLDIKKSYPSLESRVIDLTS